MAPCTINWCGKRSQTSNFKKDGITFHRYPTDPNIKQMWIEATKRQNWFPSKYSVICSRHFEKECFINMKNSRRLMSSAIPTKLLPTLTDSVEDQSIANMIPHIPTTPKRKIVAPESPSMYNTPTKKRLCRRVIELTERVVQKNKQIKNLRQKTCYMKKKIASLKSILKELEKKDLMNIEYVNILSKIGVTNKELVQRQIMKSNKKGCIVRKKYSPELRTFALTLNFYSTKAYKYVRKTFQTCLPSVKTISKWYQTVNGKPGFTKEAFIALKHKSSQSKSPLICTLVFDEMKIKSKVEYVPSTQRVFGYVDFGGESTIESGGECTEALVFLVVGMNKKFKVPIGYFLTNGTNADQKVYLVSEAIRLCNESDVIIKALTFDGCRTNIAMAKKLGCVLDPHNLETHFKNPVTNSNIFVFLDPVHMLKLFRNAFEFHQFFYDKEGRKIEWKYIKNLQELQEKEQFHLANKLRITHIQFRQNIMKVKLAAQLFSRSVAKALLFCKNELKLPEFQEGDATVEMLLLINDLFDILDSKVHGYHFKQALNQDNASNIFKKLDQCKEFLLTVSIKSQTQIVKTKLVNTPRFTGFLGFCVAIESVKGMYKDLIANESSCIKYIPFHKISQDHLELLFASIRSHGGSNDNPTPRLFESIYKKILIHTELVEVTTGNCVPLEQISILNCSSALQRINLTSTIEDKDEIQIYTESQEDIENAIESIYLSQFAESAIEYIAGFTASSLIKRLKCKTCIAALITLNENQRSFIAYRDMGGLIYPSQTVVKICRRCELILKSYDGKINKNLPRKADFLVTKTLNSFIGEQLFPEFITHQYHSDETNHVIDLTMSIMHKYISTRLAFLTKSSNQKPTVRRIYTKLIHFKND